MVPHQALKRRSQPLGPAMRPDKLLSTSSKLLPRSLAELLTFSRMFSLDWFRGLRGRRGTRAQTWLLVRLPQLRGAERTLPTWPHRLDKIPILKERRRLLPERLTRPKWQVAQLPPTVPPRPAPTLKEAGLQ